MDPATSRSVWMYTVGNHEIEVGGDGTKGFVAYFSRCAERLRGGVWVSAGWCRIGVWARALQ